MKVVALTHGPSVGPGVFAGAVRAAGHDLVEWSVPDELDAPAGADAVLVFGGAMHPDQENRFPWLLDELRFLERTLARETPVFGVCLGAQLVARAAGATVGPAPRSEIGWCEVSLTAEADDDPVFAGIPARFEAFQWHHYTYGVPTGAVELARSDACTQAFRLGRAYGIQFHAEVTEPMVARWLDEDPADVADPAALRAETARRIGVWNELGRELCSAFLEPI